MTVVPFPKVRRRSQSIALLRRLHDAGFRPDELRDLVHSCTSPAANGIWRAFNEDLFEERALDLLNRVG